MTALTTRISTIRTDCEARLPSLERYGGEARARRTVLAAIDGFERSLTWQNAIVKREATENLQSLADAWEGANITQPHRKDNKMSECAVMIPPSSPLMIAWEKYEASEDYQNSFRWAAEEPCRKGSLWAAFMAGFLAANPDGAHETTKPEPDHMLPRGM